MLTVTTPTRLPGGSIACTQGTCISDEVATGTRTAAASSAWNSDEEAAIGGDRLGAEIHQVPRRGDEVRQQAARALQHHAFSGVAPRTTRNSTGKGQVPPLPMSPGMRGKRASSIRMPSGAP